MDSTHCWAWWLDWAGSDDVTLSPTVQAELIYNLMLRMYQVVGVHLQTQSLLNRGKEMDRNVDW